jgi:oligoendopeptidase F
MFQEFFKLKAKMLGLKKLTRFDLYAPLPKTKEPELKFPEAWKLVQEVLGDFDSEFLTAAKQVVDQKHLDVFPGAQKMSGAFCMTVTNKLSPYVMLNYTDTDRDAMVLAHELGHAVHAIFAAKQSIIVQDAPLPLAETASTFAEMLMFEKLYERAKTKEEKKALLFTKISDTYATIIRQNYFVLFELEAHKTIPSGIKLEDFNNLYFENLQEQFGDSVEVDPLFKYEWAYIPHIVNSPFYCYSYSFGELLALALYNNYKKSGKEYLKIIKTILASGGSADPIKLLQSQGIDVTTGEFWQSGFDYLKIWIEELKKLC